jgi:hypothetical protein
MAEKGFFSSLFDVSFSSFVTMRIIKVIYVITLVLIALVALAFVVSAFTQSVGFGIVTLLVLAPLGALIYIIYARVLLELVMAVLRIMENTGEQVRLMQGGASGPATAATAQPSQSAPPPPPPSAPWESPPA